MLKRKRAGFVRGTALIMASLLLASMSGVAGAASGEDGGADPGTETGKTDYAAQAVQAASLEEHYRTVRPTYTLSP